MGKAATAATRSLRQAEKERPCDELARAISQCGGVTVVAYALNVQAQLVDRWRRTGVVIKTRDAVALSILTGVPVARMTPLSATVRQRMLEVQKAVGPGARKGSEAV